jgi:hypothetical protein
MGRRAAAYGLRHEVAVVLSGAYAGQAFNAPELYERCGGRSSDRLAKRIERLSNARVLGCPVCGCPLEKRFGEINRWHFAEARWASTKSREDHASHEPESAAHRAAKEQLAWALRRSLYSPWEVRTEARLESRQRVDVLALHDSGTRVAFEVQLAPLAPACWRHRHEEYQRIGVRDYWFMGAADLHRSRHALADLLADAEDQRLLYIGGESSEATEIICRDAALRPGGAGMRPPYLAVRYDLGCLTLTTSGTLLTPADGEHGRLRRAAGQRHSEELPPRIEPERLRDLARSGASRKQGIKYATPQPQPQALSSRALEEASPWAVRMQEQRRRIARRMSLEDSRKG